MNLPPSYGAPPPYGPDPYGPYPYGPPNPPQPPGQTNSLAVASLVSAFLFAPLGIVFGHISLTQIKRSADQGRPEQGRGLAVAGLAVGYVLTVMTVIMLIVGVVFFGWVASELEKDRHYRGGATRLNAAIPLPAFAPPADLGRSCLYPATATPAAKPVQPPPTGVAPALPPVVNATMGTDDGAVGLHLTNGKTPCTVKSFVSLAQQGFFDNTPCHRLTTSKSMGLLQCGDPTGSNAGGPGYRFANEYPTNQYRPFDPALKQPVIYPRGSLVMANSGPDTNGSQFFITYRDSIMPPIYTLFGTVDETGLTLIDRVALSGVIGPGDDGQPKEPLTVTSIRLDQ